MNDFETVRQATVHSPYAQAALDRIEAEREWLRAALRRIATPPYQWDSPESRDTEEVRFRIRIAAAALAKAKP